MNTLAEKVKRYTLSPFSADKGPRAALIISDIKNLGLQPFTDSAGNIWAARGKGDRAIIISAHMDTHYGTNPQEQHLRISKSGVITGTLDNSVGCAASMHLLESGMPDCTVYHIFSVGEEEGFRGAKAVRESIEKGKVNGWAVNPQLFIALDVTYPPGHGYSTPQNMDAKAFAENFNAYDVKNHVDKWIMASQFRDFVGARYIETADEALVFHERCNSMAFGPVTTGSMHSSNCRTSIESLEAVVAFLDAITKDKKFLEEMPGFSRTIRWPGARVNLWTPSGSTLTISSSSDADSTQFTGAESVYSHDKFSIFKCATDDGARYFARVYRTGRNIPLIKVRAGHFFILPAYIKSLPGQKAFLRNFYRLKRNNWVRLEEFMNDIGISVNQPIRLKDRPAVSCCRKAADYNVMRRERPDSEEVMIGSNESVTVYRTAGKYHARIKGGGFVPLEMRCNQFYVPDNFLQAAGIEKNLTLKEYLEETRGIDCSPALAHAVTMPGMRGYLVKFGEFTSMQGKKRFCHYVLLGSGAAVPLAFLRDEGYFVDRELLPCHYIVEKPNGKLFAALTQGSLTKLLPLAEIKGKLHVTLDDFVQTLHPPGPSASTMVAEYKHFFVVRDDFPGRDSSYYARIRDGAEKVPLYLLEGKLRAKIKSDEAQKLAGSSHACDIIIQDGKHYVHAESLNIPEVWKTAFEYAEGTAKRELVQVTGNEVLVKG